MMDIKIEDYLSKEEIKEICKDALYRKIREDMRRLNVNDIIANISYAEVAAMVDAYVGEDDFCKKEIPKKVHKVIDELSTYTVFRKADAWERKTVSHMTLCKKNAEHPDRASRREWSRLLTNIISLSWKETRLCIQ